MLTPRFVFVWFVHVFVVFGGFIAWFVRVLLFVFVFCGWFFGLFGLIFGC
eukprot:m.36293 g.36293  ORF g.36293 m.36293 type:complete len:50 (-) comp15965_c0_seq1:87-236(-)